MTFVSLKAACPFFFCLFLHVYNKLIFEISPYSALCKKECHMWSQGCILPAPVLILMKCIRNCLTPQQQKTRMHIWPPSAPRCLNSTFYQLILSISTIFGGLFVISQVKNKTDSNLDTMIFCCCCCCCGIKMTSKSFDFCQQHCCSTKKDQQW